MTKEFKEVLPNDDTEMEVRKCIYNCLIDNGYTVDFSLIYLMPNEQGDMEVRASATLDNKEYDFTMLLRETNLKCNDIVLDFAPYKMKKRK